MKPNVLEIVFKEGGAILIDPKMKKVFILLARYKASEIAYPNFKVMLKELLEKLDDPN